MKITEKQIILLYTLLVSSLEKNIIGYLCLDFEQRTNLLNDIIKLQEDETVIDTKDLK